MPETTDNNPSPPAWTAQLPDNLKGEQAFTGFQTIGDLAGDYLKVKGEHGELSGKMKDALFLPGNDAPEEQRTGFYERLGRPKTPDEYKIERPKMPDGLPYREEGEKKMREALHKLGLSQDQFKGIYDLYHQDAMEVWDQMQTTRMESHNKAVKSLEGKWGEQYKGNAVKAQRVAALGGEEFTKMLDASGLGDHPVMVEFLYTLWDRIGEDSIDLPGGPKLGAGGGDAADVLTPVKKRGA